MENKEEKFSAKKFLKGLLREIIVPVALALIVIQYVIDTPLVELEKKLDPRHFTRVHRSHIVAIDYIAECRKGDAGRMVMVLRDKAATQLVVSRSLVKKIKAL